jgi:DHA2 family multidrug resistance protein
MLERRSFAAYGAFLLALAEIIDISIVTVCIPQIMQALDANMDNISLVTTSYIVASAIFSLLAGFFVKKFTLKRVMLISASSFFIFSIFCGLSKTFYHMIFYRFLQGIAGAFLPSSAQTYVEQTFIETNQKKIMLGLLSVVIATGPIIGPVLGALLTGYLNWRFIFYVNVPICLTSIALVLAYVPSSSGEDIKFDTPSFLLLAIGVGCLEYFIDRGHNNHWFESHFLVWIFFISIISLYFFIKRGFTGRCVFDLALFKNFNFVKVFFLVLSFTILINATLAYFPVLLQDVYDYPTEYAGIIEIPRGLLAASLFPVIQILLTRLGSREVIVIGVGIFTLGCWFITKFPESNSLYFIIFTTLFQGVGLMFFYMGFLNICFEGIPISQAADASGAINFSRNIAGSIGNSFAASWVAFQTNSSFVNFQAFIDNYQRGFQYWSSHLNGLSKLSILELAEDAVEHGSLLMGYLNLYGFLEWCFFLPFLIPFFLKTPRTEKSLFRNIKFIFTNQTRRHHV